MCKIKTYYTNLVCFFGQEKCVEWYDVITPSYTDALTHDLTQMLNQFEWKQTSGDLSIVHMISEDLTNATLKES